LLADSGYDGAGQAMCTPVKKPKDSYDAGPDTAHKLPAIRTVVASRRRPSAGPGSDSAKAQKLQQEGFSEVFGDSVDIAVRVDAGIKKSRKVVASLSKAVDVVPHVATVDEPFKSPGCISADGHALLAQAYLDAMDSGDMTLANAQQIVDAAEKADHDGFEVAVNGQSILQTEHDLHRPELTNWLDGQFVVEGPTARECLLSADAARTRCPLVR
jgi:hypothetical protein